MQPGLHKAGREVVGAPKGGPVLRGSGEKRENGEAGRRVAQWKRNKKKDPKDCEQSRSGEGSGGHERTRTVSESELVEDLSLLPSEPVLPLRLMGQGTLGTHCSAREVCAFYSADLMGFCLFTTERVTSP